MSFTFDIINNNLEDYVDIQLTGEIDISTAEKFKELLFSIIDTNNKNIRLDCSDLVYLDSSGLGIIISAYKRAKEKDIEIHIHNLKKNIEKLFTITNLDKILVIKR